MAIVLDGNNLLTTGVLNSMTAQSASGTSVDFTGIPAGVKRVTVSFSALSTTGTAYIRFQLGTSSGIDTSGYVAMGSYTGASSASVAATSGFDSYGDGNAANSRNGSAVFTLVSANTWICVCAYQSAAYTNCWFIQGTKTLSSTLDRVRITTTNGTDTFDAGTINVLYE